MEMWLWAWCHFIFLWSIRHWSWCVHRIFYFFGYRVGNLNWDWDFYMLFTNFFNNLCTLFFIGVFINNLVIGFALFFKCLHALFLGNVDSCWIAICDHLSLALRHNLCSILHFVHSLTYSVWYCITFLPYSLLKPCIFALFNRILLLTSWKY